LACALLSAVAAGQWMWWRFHPERRGNLISNHTVRLSIAGGDPELLAAPGLCRWLCRLPGNEVFSPWLQEKELVLPHLPRGHHGLRVVHLTDLHMSGRIAKTYFERVVEEVNRCEADLVLITGDIIERAECIDWV